LVLLLALSGCSTSSTGAPAAPATVSRQSSQTATQTAAQSSGTTPSLEATAPGPHTPAAGSAERAAILDGLRPAIKRDLGQAVTFKVKTLAVQDGFAFAQVAALAANGKPVDYRKTRYRKGIDQGFFDDSDAPVYALLHHAGGRWTVLTFVVGPTDVAYAGWWQEYQAPKAIFPYTE